MKGDQARDYGGNGRGRIKGSVEYWHCRVCGKRQRESVLARYRKTKPRCKECGWYVQPLHEFRGEPKARKCKTCGCNLRSGNPLDYCNPCFNAKPYHYRRKAMGLPS